jgi:hypothetical protein
MWIDRQIFAIIDEHDNKVTPKNNAHQISSIKTEALLISFHNTFHCTQRTGDMAFIYSEILSLRLHKSAECV